MSSRSLYFLSFILICLLLLFSLYLEFYEGVIPCPLCTMQRLTFAFLGGLFLFGALLAHFIVPRLLIHCLSLLTAVTGLTFACRQIWLQHYPPPGVDACGVSLQYMMKVLPFNEVLRKIFAGTAECTARSWEFLTLDMAEWSACWFILFTIVSLYLLKKEWINK